LFFCKKKLRSWRNGLVYSSGIFGRPACEIISFFFMLRILRNNLFLFYTPISMIAPYVDHYLPIVVNIPLDSQAIRHLLNKK
jgi:hypothetical protein